MKAYTDLKQSEKLAEILPLESADMGWYYSRDPNAARNQMWLGTKAENADIPCWSLAALLDVLPKEINVLGTIYSINIHTRDEKWFIDYKCNNEEFVGVYSSIFVDACYEMILKLNEQKLI
jgi:hypothetical protein